MARQQGHFARHHAQLGTAGAARLHARNALQDVFFGAGEWRPGTPGGDRLIAHELTHVVQNDEGRLPDGGGVSHPSDPAEREAYRNESKIVGRLPAVDAALPGSRPEAAATAEDALRTTVVAEALVRSMNDGGRRVGVPALDDVLAGGR